MKKHFLIALFVLACYDGFSQKADWPVRALSDSVVKKYFHHQLDSSKYLLYKMGQYYYVRISEDTSCYRQYIIEETGGIKNSKKLEKENETLKRAFNLTAYKQQFIDMDSDTAYKNYSAPLLFIYFVVKNKGSNYGEFYLPMAKESIYPIDSNLHDYLIQELVAYWNDQVKHSRKKHAGTSTKSNKP